MSCPAEIHFEKEFRRIARMFDELFRSIKSTEYESNRFLRKHVKR